MINSHSVQPVCFHVCSSSLCGWLFDILVVILKPSWKDNQKKTKERIKYKIKVPLRVVLLSTKWWCYCDSTTIPIFCYAYLDHQFRFVCFLIIFFTFFYYIQLIAVYIVLFTIASLSGKTGTRSVVCIWNIDLYKQIWLQLDETLKNYRSLTIKVATPTKVCQLITEKKF